MRKNVEIKKILSITILLLAIIPIIVLSLLSANSNRKISEINYEQNGKQLLSISENIIDDKMQDYVNDLEVVVKNGEFDNLDAVKAFVTAIANEDESLLNYYYGDEKTGNFTQSSNEKLPEGYKAKSRPWYKASKESPNDVLIQSPYKDAITGKTVITLSQAIVKNNELVGVLGMDVDLTVLAERLSALKYGRTGQIMICAEDGFVVSNTDVSKIGSQEPKQYSVWNNILKNNSGDINFKNNSKNYIGYYRTSKITGWKIILKTEAAELNETVIKQLKTTAIIIIVIMIITISITIFVSKKIAGDVNTIADGLIRASKGDFKEKIELDSPIKEFNILGDSFNNMKENLGGLIGNVDEAVNNVYNTSNSSISMSEDISSSIEQVSNTMSEIAQGTTKSADGLENISSDMEALSQSITNMKNEADNVSNSAGEANELGKRGLRIADLVMNKSQDTKNSIGEVDNVVTEVARSIEKIDDINSSIAAITEQTNLLALNAAIEAARAGEAGKGFAVVAEEIRKLAEETAVSAKEIDSIIKELDEKSKSVVERVKETNGVVTEQENAVLESQQIFKDIVLSVENLSGEILNIAKGITHINGMKESVVDKVGDLSALLEETAAGSEEVTASAEEISSSTEKFVEDLSELKEKSEELKNKIETFKF